MIKTISTIFRTNHSHAINMTFGAWAIALQLFFCNGLLAQDKPEIPHIDSIVPSLIQPQKIESQTIWFDDFDSGWKEYPEKSGNITSQEVFGGKGRALETFYPKGEKGGGKGACKVWFGDNPINYGHVGTKIVCKSKRFDEIYARVYVKHQHGWEGGAPAKLMRMTSFENGNFAQSMISHLWAAGDLDYQTLDPVCCVRNGRVLSTKYNDWNAMKWLGNSPHGLFPLARADWWVCVEFHTRLNTPGASDGMCEVWIDGKLDCIRTNLDFRGTYTNHSINSVMLEAYWNKGAPKDLYRWFDNFVVSQKPIGPIVCPPNPMLIKTPFYGSGRQAGWNFELAEDADLAKAVFISNELGVENRGIVTSATGEFRGVLAGKNQLESGRTYVARCRQKNDAGTWSQWSPWHQKFRVE